MKIWFDTEFYEDGKTVELISIGAVREDGVEYYAEVPNARDLCVCAEDKGWLEANVMPQLHLGLSERKVRGQIAADLFRFVGPNPEFWAYYADYDWVVLCQLYGRMIDLPAGWPKYCRDLKQLADMYNVKLPAQTTQEHNGLNDARWCKDAHLWLSDYLLEKGL